MRSFNCFVLFILLTVGVQAQRNHYIYIQTENKQAFYIKLKEKLFSSTGSGYLIIPKLTSEVYKLEIGFPKNEWPSQQIEITVNDRDQGFLLKNFGEKGWGLFNILSMDILMATTSSSLNTASPQLKTDAFSNTLADVTNTPAIREVAVTPTPTAPVTAETVKAVVIPEEKKTETVAEPVESKPQASASSKLQVRQLFTILDNTGRSTVYAINDGNEADTVRVFIPYAATAEAVKNDAVTTGTVKENTTSRDSVNAVTAGSTDTTETTTSPAADAAVDVPSQKPLITVIDTEQTTAAKKNNSSLTIINPACTTRTSSSDFSKLQRKMAAAADDEARIALAKKLFRSKCLATEQLSLLSPLFTNDQGRYNFYDAAYDHVSDIGNFKSLQSQLSEEYYINRFKAMLR